jgi:hypothetical protein
MRAAKRLSETDWLEVPIFIHGVSYEEKPPDHKLEYGSLLKAINTGLKERGKPVLSKPLYVEWGREYPGSKGMDQYLAIVESRLNTLVKESMGPGNYSSVPIIYKTIRELIFFALDDLMYYVSSDGETALRKHVFRDVADRVMKLANQKSNRISLTFISHSAGTLIAHDLLYHLYGKKYKRGELAENELKGIMKYARKIGSAETSSTLLRIRRLYTFGSPLSLLSVRSNALINKLRAKKIQLLDTEDIGLRAADGLANPRWVNFWDKDDLIAAPVAFLYKNTTGVIEDVPVNAGAWLPAAHTNYWFSLEMANYIANTF